MNWRVSFLFKFSSKINDYGDKNCWRDVVVVCNWIIGSKVDWCSFSRILHSHRYSGLSQRYWQCLNSCIFVWLTLFYFSKGYAYDPNVQFPCGSMQNTGYQPLYYWASTGCCAQGIPFDKSSQYCCFDGVHDYSTGYCGPWTPTAAHPTCYDCTAAKSTYLTNFTAPVSEIKTVEMKESAVVPAPIDTTIKNTGDWCYTATSTLGCLNTYTYDYKTTYPCGNFLLSLDDYGCCLGSTRTYYSYKTDSCCWDPNSGSYNVSWLFCIQRVERFFRLFFVFEVCDRLFFYWLISRSSLSVLCTLRLGCHWQCSCLLLYSIWMHSISSFNNGLTC